MTTSVETDDMPPGLHARATFMADEDGDLRCTELVFSPAGDSDRVTATHLRGYSLPRAAAQARAQIQTSEEAPLVGEFLPRGSRPDGSDDWYRSFVAHYAVLATHYSAPAKAAAEYYEAPVATVHRWSSEARRRGLMSGAYRAYPSRRNP